MPYRLDTESRVYFYPDEFYCLSNFAPFRLHWRGLDFDTSEHVYHYEKFRHPGVDDACHIYCASCDLQCQIRVARSAHAAFRVAQDHAGLVASTWHERRMAVMRAILIAKLRQHEYVRRKLLETGDREIVEDSWRDATWGWGPNHDGQNLLGKLWMALREDLKAGRLEGMG